MARETAILPSPAPVADSRIARRASQYVDMIRNVFLTEGGWRFADAFYLVGGFARDEPTCDWHKGELRIYNDLDFLVVTRRCTPRVLLGLRRIHRKLNDGRFGCAVDLVPMMRREICAPPPIIFHYDIQQHSRLVWGDDVLAGVVRRLEPGELSRSDALQLLLNRQASLLIGLEMLRHREVNLPYLQVQLSKPLLATMSAALIARGRYVVSVAEQLRRVETELATETTETTEATEVLFSAFFRRSDVLALLREAVEFRVQPSAKHFAPSSDKSHEIARTFHEFLRAFLVGHYSLDVDSEIETLVQAFRETQPTTCHPAALSWWAARHRCRAMGLSRWWDIMGRHPQIDVYAAQTLWLAEFVTGRCVDWRSFFSPRRRTNASGSGNTSDELGVLIDAWKASGYGCRVE